MMMRNDVMLRRKKKALMLAVFGAAGEAAITFDELLPLARECFPGRTVVVPYTSAAIRDRINARIPDPDKKLLSPEAMLAKLQGPGYDDISVVSTLVFAGVEHDKLSASVEAFRAANPGIAVTYAPPILAERANLRPVLDLLGKYLLSGASNVVVAHGTHPGHAAEATYLELAKIVPALYPHARLGSIEGLPDMAAVLERVKADPAGEVRFVPFMFVAGAHVQGDIVSDAQDSLFSAVRRMGKRPSVPLAQTGTGSGTGARIAARGLDPEYRQVLLAHYLRCTDGAISPPPRPCAPG
jgi:cobalamin biosynthesis Co2+ chelatase CbiK